MLTQQFLVDGQYLGSCQRYPLLQHGHPQPPQSYGFVCPHCGDVWARAWIDNHPFFFFTRSCRKHHSRSLAPAGSLWLPLEIDFTAALPEAVMRRELLLHLDHIEQWNPYDH